MNRIQFFILTGLSTLLVLFLIGHIFLVRETNFKQNQLVAAQRVVSQAQVYQGYFKQLVTRIYNDIQKSQDPGLKELLSRQQITITSTPAGANTTDTSAPSTTPSTSTH
jgi:uncharacterized protein YpmS